MKPICPHCESDNLKIVSVRIYEVTRKCISCQKEFITKATAEEKRDFQ
jgi:hypothetical protein